MGRDYVFRYRLQAEGKGYPSHDRLLEMIRAQFKHILDLVIPVSGQKEINIDGFKLLRDSGDTCHTFPNDPPGEDMTAAPGIKNAALYEPRIDFIRRQLESLLAVVEVEKDGQVVKIDGFKLKNLQDWLVPSSCDPVEVFGYAGSHCNADCVFCYNKGNPPSLALGNSMRPAEEEFEEMMTRINYFSPKSGQSLFPSLGVMYEVLLHPKCLEVLGLLRRKTDKVFRLTTNGVVLTPALISELANLQPLYLYLSLNSSSQGHHQELVRSKNPEIPLQSLALLREKGIPFAAVIVPWPLDSLSEMLGDLAETVAYADEHQAHLIQINLPGYSKYFSPEKLFDLDEVWSATVSCVRELRGSTAAPIVVMPSMYEENLYEEPKNQPRIIGLVRNSPAALSGLKKGDLILEINGLGISSRPQARDILALLRKNEARQASLVVARDGEHLDAVINLDRFAYPYSPSHDSHLGIIMMGTGFRLSYMEGLREIIDSHQAKRLLLLSSTLVKPSLEQAVRECRLFADGGLRIDILVPGNNFFGGNIFMGDLLVVQDFIDCIREYLQKGGAPPELIVIPSSPFNLGQWQRDLTGRVYLDIEKEVGIPVKLLECTTIYD